MTDETRDVWAGLMGEDAEGPYLVGGHCVACGHVSLGLRSICPGCWREQTMVPVPVGRRGQVYSATVIHQVPEGHAGPYAAGYVDIEDGLRIFAHLAPEVAKSDRPVRLTRAVLKHDRDGTPLVGPRYVE